jgi:hypothetical protein
VADVVVSYSNEIQGVETDGNRSVEVTLDFDTGDYVALGVPISLAALGLRVVERAFVVASQHVDNKYLQSSWVTANDTVTYNYFVDIQTDGTPQAPVLKVYSAGNELSGAFAATAQVRLRLVGS